jgi:hypothetical protein
MRCTKLSAGCRPTRRATDGVGRPDNSRRTRDAAAGWSACLAGCGAPGLLDSIFRNTAKEIKQIRDGAFRDHNANFSALSVQKDCFHGDIALAVEAFPSETQQGPPIDGLRAHLLAVAQMAAHPYSNVTKYRCPPNRQLQNIWHLELEKVAER